jgi:dynein heavy chain
MKFYPEGSKVVKPKMEALAMAEGQMEAAITALTAAEARLAACKKKLAVLQKMLDSQMGMKRTRRRSASASKKDETGV